jgi:hypothetical protein
MDLLSNRAWDKTRPTRAQKGGAGSDSNGSSIAGAKKATHHVK